MLSVVQFFYKTLFFKLVVMALYIDDILMGLMRVIKIKRVIKTKLTGTESWGLN